MEFIAQMEPSFDMNERKAMDEYMAGGGWLMEFKKTREFEKMIAEYTGAEYCSVMPNGTISLSCALIALGVGVGDEVIVPDYTMVATPNSVELIGAKAVFVDIEPDTLCMDLEAMKKAVTPKTRAVMAVSINGRAPSRMDEIVSFCRENGIRLVEDAAQSLGSRHGGRHLGTIGDIGSFSFSVPKIITTGQGGALVTNNGDLYEKILKIRDFGREKSGSDHYLTKGWNFKFTDMQSVIGIEQMKKLSYRVARKKEMGRLYKNGLKNIPGVELLPTDLEQTAPWFFDILCERRTELIAYLKDNNIGTREFYPPLHREPAYGYCGKSFPVTENISSRGLWLPSSVLVTDNQINYICELIRSFYY